MDKLIENITKHINEYVQNNNDKLIHEQYYHAEHNDIFDDNIFNDYLLTDDDYNDYTQYKKKGDNKVLSNRLLMYIIDILKCIFNDIKFKCSHDMNTICEYNTMINRTYTCGSFPPLTEYKEYTLYTNYNFIIKFKHNFVNEKYYHGKSNDYQHTLFFANIINLDNNNNTTLNFHYHLNSFTIDNDISSKIQVSKHNNLLLLKIKNMNFIKYTHPIVYLDYMLNKYNNNYVELGKILLNIDKIQICNFIVQLNDYKTENLLLNKKNLELEEKLKNITEKYDDLCNNNEKLKISHENVLFENSELFTNNLNIIDKFTKELNVEKEIKINYKNKYNDMNEKYEFNLTELMEKDLIIKKQNNKLIELNNLYDKLQNKIINGEFYT